jgi:hypothetical protein
LAAQTISVNTNHDDATGRLAGQSFTLNSGATLLIDSCPHLTPMGPLGDMISNDGTIRIDGTRSFTMPYGSGVGTRPTAIPTAVTWAGGGSGKIIRYDEDGGPFDGVLSITVDEGSPPLVAFTTLTTATYTFSIGDPWVAYLPIHITDQDWGATDARSGLVIEGAWYLLGTGNGSPNQTFSLPHAGHQPAIWVETGNGTDIFQKWFRTNSLVSTVYYDGPADFSNTYESGFCFKQVFGSTTLQVGTVDAGGVIPSGARVRIPNIHLATVTTGAPTTELNAVTVLLHAGVVAPNVNLNVQIDKCNASSVYLDFRGTNAVTVTSSCWGLSTTTAMIQKVNAPVVISDCAVVTGSTADYAAANVVAIGIVDNTGGVVLDNCLFYGGINTTNAGAFILTTTANVAFTGVTKIVSNQQDENTMATLRGSVASNVTAETLILVGGPIIAGAGCSDWTIDEVIYGLPPGRGTTEITIQGVAVLSGTLNMNFLSGRRLTGTGIKNGTVGLFSLTDCSNTLVRLFGEVDNKLDATGNTYIASLVGVTTNTTFQRVWTENAGGTQQFVTLNSVANLLIENCSGTYNKEIELDSSRVLVKGLHGASGAVEASTGVEGNLVNCIATVFLDYFKSDTTGALGLLFNDRGQVHLADVEIAAGTPVFNGLGSLLMRTAGDQVVYTWPYSIRGHTAFLNAAIQLSGTNTGNLSYEYALFAGGWSAYQTLNGANLSAETISPAGFRIRIRITCVTGSATNLLRGFAILTATTIADQKANLYPLDEITLTLTGVPSGVRVTIVNSATRVELQSGVSVGADITYAYEVPETVDVLFMANEYAPILSDIYDLVLPASDATIPINLLAELNYANP